MGNEPQAIPPQQHRAADLRASDADREQVAAVLQTAFAEGRLTMAELDERLATVYAARTYAELTPVTQDLPGPGTPQPPIAAPAPAPPSPPPGPATPGDVAVLSSFHRRGRWVVGREFRCVAVLGNGKIDLREARFTEGETTIRVFSLLSSMQVLVPENAEVHITGFGLMGEFDHSSTVAPAAFGGPRITITGCTVLGNVAVRRRSAAEEWLRQKSQRIQQRMERRQLRMERRLSRRRF